jgi:hypothetical protein
MTNQAASRDPCAVVTLVSIPTPAGGQAADAPAPLSGDGKRREHDE